MNDLKLAFRQLLKNPGFTTVAVLTLALGIGANTAIFSVLNNALFQGLPYPGSDRLVMITERNAQGANELFPACPASFFTWQDQAKSFDKIAAVHFANFNLSGVEMPERLEAGQVSKGFLEMLGAKPVLGRTFRDEEFQGTNQFVTVLSHSFWERRFGSDPAIIEKSIVLNGRPHTVVGVLGPDFRFAHPAGISGWSTGWSVAQVWRPRVFDSEQREVRDAHYLMVIGRLRPGLSLSSARAEMEAITRREHQRVPTYIWGVDVEQWHERVVSRSRPMFVMLAGAAAFLLLIACANIANLLLARAMVRQKEFAIRIALGAGRWQIARQLVCEGFLISIAGAILGLLLALWITGAVTALSSGAIPLFQRFRLDLQVLGFTGAACLITTLVFGLIPLAQAFRGGIQESLSDGSRSSSETLRRNPLRAFLVIAEVAAAIVLLSGAGLLLRSLWELQRVNPGFKSDQLLVADISLVDRRYVDWTKRVQYAGQLLEQVRLLPEVKAAATVYGLPLGSMINDAWFFTIDGEPPPPTGQEPMVAYRFASSGYFGTMGIPLLEGRDFSSRDTTNATEVAIINEALARQYFKGGNPIGRRMRIGGATYLCEIVGVVGNVKPDGLDAATPPEIYRPMSQACDWYLSIVARTAGQPERVGESLRRAAHAIDPSCPVYNVRTMGAQVADSLTTRRFVFRMIWLFAGIAVLLAAVGIYGVLAFSVGRRTRELGIRMALGARRRDILFMVLRQGMTLTWVGVATGLVLASLLVRTIKSFLYGITAADPVTYVGVGVVLSLVALLACWLPARRATKVDPADALRHE
jgi:predicted permease